MVAGLKTLPDGALHRSEANQYNWTLCLSGTTNNQHDVLMERVGPWSSGCNLNSSALTWKVRDPEHVQLVAEIVS